MDSAVRFFHFLIGKLLDQYCRWFSRGVVVSPDAALSSVLETDQVTQGDEPIVIGQHELATEIVIAAVHNLESPAEFGGLVGVGAEPHHHINPPYNFDWGSIVIGTDQIAQSDHEPGGTGQQSPDSATEIGIASVHNLESPVESGGLVGVDRVATDPQVNPPYIFDWRSMVIGACLTSAIEIALQSLQPHINMPLLVHLLLLALVFAFSSFFVSSFFSTDHPMFSHALIQVGKLSVFLAFFLAITVPFSPFFRIILWSIGVLSLLAIIYVVATSGRLRP